MSEKSENTPDQIALHTKESNNLEDDANFSRTNHTSSPTDEPSSK
jgi:hypothetical protein